MKWGLPQFKTEFFAELHVRGGLNIDDRLDANWITNAFSGELPSDWMSKYWAGESMTGQTPIWEYLASNTAYVLGTDLRERSYQLLKSCFPQCVRLLETARVAVHAGSNLGSIACFLNQDTENEYIRGTYLMDMRDADNPGFLKKIKELIDSGHPVRREDYMEEDGFVTPDLGPLGFKLLKTDFPFVRPSMSQ
ncbi:hypothetical protein HJB84_17425 [Rhizobium sp. NZLR1b]|uniref:hypothetical protein n=1 Tax=Rhizobium sp. NZLR1b TaxID=2731099 RepID=UPI001C82F497|nr:hypothetical protein [Rhizobium sp. NZLR1b]MBX5171620.1 hypothetical protein [Rhizobium sp. NZLR1b]